MLKYALLASALAIGAPAIAQDMATPAPAQDAPAAPDAATQAAPAEQAQAPAQAGQPAAAGLAQVAQVVKNEFPTYDKDADGKLTDVEFAQWMGALRKASDPTFDTAAAESQTWFKGAFAQADTDKDGKVSEAELTGFLTAAQAG